MTQPSLLARCRGATDGGGRVETDVTDSELQRLIDEANQEIIRRYGPHADPANPITVRLEGGGQTLDLVRPLDETEDFTIVEFWRAEPFGTPQQTELTSDDFRVWYGGRTLERVYTGPNNFGRTSWGRDPAPEDRFGWGGSAGWVEITYVPINDGDQREEAILKLVRLELDYDPSLRIEVGDVRRYPVVDQAAERERILATLMPRRGLFLR